MKRVLTAAAIAWLVLCCAVSAQGQLPGGVGAMTPTNPPQVGTGTSTAPVTASGVFNANSLSLLHWRAAVARVQAGTGRGRLLILGDSTSMGAGAGSGGTTNQNGAFAKAWPRYLSSILTSRGVQTSDLNFVGMQQTSVAIATYDTRVSVGSWGANIAQTMNATSAGTFAFSPGSSIDTVNIWYVKNGIFTANFDGGATAFTSAAGGGLTFQSSGLLSTTLGTHTVNLVWSSGNAFFKSVLAYNSTAPAIDIMQNAIFGGFSASYDPTQSNIFDGPIEIQAYAPDLTIINLTINDSNTNGLSGLPTYITNMQALITAAKVSGDVLLMVGIPSNTANATNGTLQAYEQAILGLAVSNNAAFLSMRQRWGSYAITNPAMAYFDSLHATSVGYSDMGRAVADVLTTQY